MTALDNAQYMLDRSQGDVKSQEHKNDLLMQSLVSAVIAVADELNALNEKLDRMTYVHPDYFSNGKSLEALRVIKFEEEIAN